MFTHHALQRALAAALAVSLVACSDTTVSPSPSATRSQLSGVASTRPALVNAASTISWNQTARDLIAARALTTPLPQLRILTYLSVAQYNATVDAENSRVGQLHVSPAAAAAGASLVVLKSFFPADAAMLDAKLDAQRAAAPPGERTIEFTAGESIGRTIGASVVAFAATDNTGLTPPPPNPGGPGNWTGTNPLRLLYGARTFALVSGNQFRPGPPPAFGSPVFNAALAQIRSISDGLTPAQLAIAQLWAPRGPAYMNSVATDILLGTQYSERAAARVLALANMAGFDVGSACFDAKFAYYLIRPSQADPQIKLPIGLPNHPSYPSGHSCITAAYAAVISNQFPAEAARLQAMVSEAGLSRMYGGLHYRFDCETGQRLGRQVAGYVLQVFGNRTDPIPLN